MRIQKVVCDRCGEEIQADPYQIYCEQIDLGTGDFTAEETFPQIQGRDFCIVCAKQIVDFIMAEGAVDMVEEPLGKEAGKASKGTRSKIDWGKATALKNAGWAVKDIAGELSVSPAVISQGFYRMKSEKGEKKDGDNN